MTQGHNNQYVGPMNYRVAVLHDHQNLPPQHIHVRETLLVQAMDIVIMKQILEHVIATQDIQEVIVVLKIVLEIAIIMERVM